MTKKAAAPEAGDDAAMTPERFRTWRKRLGLKQRDAAERLGLKKRMIQYYEKGRRDGKEVTIPKTVRLACFAVTSGIGDFDGEESRAATSPAEIAPSVGDEANTAPSPETSD